MRDRPVLVDTNFVKHLGTLCVSLDAAIQEHYGPRAAKIAAWSGLVRGLMALRLGRRFDLVVAAYGCVGCKWIVLLHALFSRRAERLMLLQFIVPPKAGLRRIAFDYWLRWVFGPAFRRAVRAAQVMTRWEIERSARLLGVPEERFRHIPWPLSDGSDAQATRATPPDGIANRRVISSGRAACDWETLFRAAAGTDWELTVICGRADREEVARLSSMRPATALCDISQEEHRRAVEASSVYVLCLKEQAMSSGHVRLMNAISAGVPVVATCVRGLEGYAVDRVNAILVDPGDHDAIRREVNGLLNDRAEAHALRERAWASVRERTLPKYYESLSQVFLEVAAKAASDAGGREGSPRSQVS